MALRIENPYYKLLDTDEEIVEDFELMSRNARETQLELLRKILERNANVEYLQRQGLNGRTDEASFKACVPVSTYANIEADVDRIADGDTSPICCVDPPTSFALRLHTCILFHMSRIPRVPSRLMLFVLCISSRCAVLRMEANTGSVTGKG